MSSFFENLRKTKWTMNAQRKTTQNNTRQCTVQTRTKAKFRAMFICRFCNNLTTPDPWATSTLVCSETVRYSVNTCLVAYSLTVRILLFFHSWHLGGATAWSERPLALPQRTTHANIYISVRPDMFSELHVNVPWTNERSWAAVSNVQMITSRKCKR